MLVTIIKVIAVLIAALIVFPTVIALRRWQGSKDVIHIGPLMFRDRTPFMALWCLLYILVAVAFFPYREPAPPRAPVPAEQATSYTHPSHALPADNPHDIT